MDWTNEAINALYADIGGRVRRARKRKGLSQDDLGQAVHLRRTSIANLEAGRQHPPVHVILLIAQVTESPVAELLPTIEDLARLVTVQRPTVDLAGQSDSTLDFVTTAIRRATGG